MLGATPLTRRRVAIGIGSLLLGGATYTLATDTSRAAVSLDIPDQTYSAPDGDLHAPWLLVNTTFSYTNVDAADRARVELLVDGDAIGQRNLSLSGASDTLQFDMAGDVTDSGAYDSSVFTQPTDGQSATVDVPVQLVARIYDDKDEELVTASASTVVTITITNEAEPSITIEGTGEVRLQANESDPAPV